MSYFLGLSVPDEMRERIVAFQRSIPGNTLPAHVEPHITIKAKNGLDEERSWLSAVEAAVAAYPAFDVSFTGIGDFQNEVLFLEPAATAELIGLHALIVKTIRPDPASSVEYFEGNVFHPHLTLCGTRWGLTPEAFESARERARKELSNIGPSHVSFLRVYQKTADGSAWQTFTDLALGVRI